MHDAFSLKELIFLSLGYIHFKQLMNMAYKIILAELMKEQGCRG